MKLADVSIERPVFTAMMMLAMIVVGGVMFSRLSVDLFPEVDFPVVTVTTVYPGADPETMENKVADPIEEAVNSLSGIKALRSTSVEGVAQVFMEFELDVDLDVAAQDVRDRVASIQGELPRAAEQPTVEKLDLGAAPIMQIAISGPAGMARLSSYAEDVLKPALEGVRGVGQLELLGSQERELHVWPDPAKLERYQLTILDVVDAISAQSRDVPGGRITRAGHELVIRTNAQANTEDGLAEIPIATRNDAVIRVGDVAQVVDGFEELRSMASLDGEPSVALVVRKQSDANTVAVADRVQEALPGLRERAPQGTKIEVVLDNSREIRASIEAVQLDLALGAFLAVAIIFLFLRDARATFISALALPTSVIGAFAFVHVMGFTLNMMTTLALSLSIGILIDDAIVVIENIVRHRTELGEKAFEAAHRGTAEIGLAVLATTLSIVAVFIPVAFMDGMVGQFFYEFGLTVAFAVMLSLFVSFTLTPSLSARLLKAHHEEDTGLLGFIEKLLRGIESLYRATVHWALRHRFLTMLLAVATLIGTFALVPLLGFEFTPVQDKAQFSIKLETPVGTALDETAEQTFEVAEEVGKLPGVVKTFSTVGGGAQEQVNLAEIVVLLVHKSQRAFSQEDIMARVRQMFAGQGGVRLSVEEIQAVSGGGMRAAPIQFNLRGHDLDQLQEVAHKLTEKLRATPGFVDVDTTFRTGKPEINVDVDRAAAADLGVYAGNVGRTVRTLAAGEVASQYEAYGDRYDVRVQLPPNLRTSRAVIERALVRGATGESVEIGHVADVTEGTGPSQIDRQARRRQVTVLANLEEIPLGDALEVVRAAALDIVPDGITTDFTGRGEMMADSVSSMGFALLMAVIFIYMILASQFESFVHPLTIMASLPFSLIGAFGGLLLTGMHMSIFAMIGFIMLFGLVTKNAILLVDFANQLRARGESVLEALENAGVVRLRPILMTTAAMVFGMLPVAIGHGDGGEVRAPMGVTVIGGLLTSTVLTLVVVPVIYTFMEAIAVFFGRFASRLSAQDDDPESPEEAAAAAE